MLIRLAWRNIWRNKRRTIITVTSIGFGLACAVFFISLAEGVYSQLINDGVRLQAGHITLEHPEYRDAPAIDLYVSAAGPLRKKIEHLPGVEQTKLLVLGQGVAKSGLGTVGVAVMGIEPAIETNTSPLAGCIVAGRYLEETDRAKAVIGSGLAERLHLDIGKKLVLTTNDVTGALTEDLLRVAGIFETGSEEIDGYLLQVPISFMRKLYGIPPEGATQLGVILTGHDIQAKTRQAITGMVPKDDIAVHPWQDIIPELASYIKMDRGSNLIFQAILIFLILFTIFNTILMSVLERQKEFAVLLAIGTRPAHLNLQLLAESFFIGLVGCFFGLLIGGVASYIIQVHGFDISSLSSESMSIAGLAVSPIMHAKLTPTILIGCGGLVLCATLLLSVIPMRRASKTDIAETLRSQ